MNSRKLLMGNEAIALGALHAGVNLVCGYPGTPSTEVLETAARENDGGTYVEWSVNEKVAMELGGGASYAGARVLVTMKQMGLNVASDPLMCLSYIGCRGGLVILVADDPGPISSQTEQDTRHFGQYAHLPVLDPSSVQEAYDMARFAFALSESFGTPVILRPTTRVCHACASVELREPEVRPRPEGFEKDPRWVIFPKLSYECHLKLEKRTRALAEAFEAVPFNRIEGDPGAARGVIVSGVSYLYLSEAVRALGTDVKILKLGAAVPFPEKLAERFLDGLTEVLAVEELDPVLEDALTLYCGSAHKNVRVRGKRDGTVKAAGENSVESVRASLASFLGLPSADARSSSPASAEAPPALPVRPPVLCAGCPHRASFYAVKKALRGQKAVFCGDIGCYTLGNAKPLDMVDTCLCMGAGITVAQGLHRVEPDVRHLAFIGDSTFFHSGITGVIDAVYNQTDITVILLDNSTTAMTGQQPHPGTGKTMMGGDGVRVDTEAVLRGCGVGYVKTVNPFDQEAAARAVREAVAHPAVSAVIFKAPCIALFRSKAVCRIGEGCIRCKRCITELGCPAISVADDGSVVIEPSLCNGCGLCMGVCPKNCIVREGE